MALNRSPEFCLKLAFLLITDHVPVDTWARSVLALEALFEQTW